MLDSNSITCVASPEKYLSTRRRPTYAPSSSLNTSRFNGNLKAGPHLHY